MVRLFALVFGIFFVACGVMGYMPALVTGGRLFEYFEVNEIRSIAYIIIGAMGLFSFLFSSVLARFYFQISSILFALVTVLGFWHSGDIYIMQLTTADNVLHLVITVVALYIGFLFDSARHY